MPPGGDPVPLPAAGSADTLLAWRDALDAGCLEVHRPGCTTITLSPRSPAGTFTPAQAWRLHRAVVDRLRTLLVPERERRTYRTPWGPVTVLAVPVEPHRAKTGCLRLEERDAVGELTDADVVLPVQLRRWELGLPPRPCLVCDAPAKRCIALRRHSWQSVVAVARLRHARAFDGPPDPAPPLPADAPTPCQAAIRQEPS
ncbi:citrate lyase holo-[acyl-carrier protein] synthase [Streptomyces sp. NPDC005931]|uniref:citrate lyase holo-[acyl-carrier protein] synthase n=1 Tax=Streptomyces sp. NPDC005931 TaxID=3364737 RepID=UPI003677B126